jgi:hypothetical protein
MSHDGRADDDIADTPDAELVRRLIESNDAAEPAPFNERLVGAALRKPLADEDRVALQLLIDAGKMARQRDGGWGLRPLSKRLLTLTVANRLKARDLAVPGFDKVTLYPSTKGKQIIAQEETNAGTPQ